MLKRYVVDSHSYKKKARNFPDFSALQEIYETPPLLASFGGSWEYLNHATANWMQSP